MQLRPFLKGVADAIRGKEGSTATIPAVDFASRIANLPSGEDEIDRLVEGTVTEFVNDRVTFIKPYLFCTSLEAYNRSLKSVRCASAERIGTGAFYGCSSLSHLYLPNVYYIGRESFVDTFHESSTRGLSFPSCAVVDSYAFVRSHIETLYINGFSADEYGGIGNSAFYHCSLQNLVIQSEEGVSYLANADVFEGTSIYDGIGYIYVPRSFVDAYKTADNWSTYANQIRALEDYTVDGTTTGELDPNKI